MSKKEDESKIAVTTMTSCENFWSGFAIQENLKRVFSTKLSPDSITSIHGIRAIVSIWATCNHIYTFGLATFSNLKLSFSNSEYFLFQPYFAAYLIIEVFVVLGGFLLSFNFYEAQKKRSSNSLVKLCLKNIFSRFFQTLLVLFIVSYLTFECKVTIIFLIQLAFAIGECSRNDHQRHFTVPNR